MSESGWTDREVTTLREWYGTRPASAIARMLGRSLASVKSKANRMGLVSTRRLSTDEVALIRRHYGIDKTAEEIAVELGRTKTSIYQAAQRVVPERIHRKVCIRGAVEDRARALHAEGWSDAEIADEVGCERHTVGDWRRRVGLGDNALSERRRRKVAAKTREQLRRAGLGSLGELRVRVYRERARRAGWPEDLRERSVQILNALWERGPMTRREIADAIGMPWKGSRASLVSNDPEGSYLAHLTARGLVVNLGRIRKVTGKGRGRSVCVYSLPIFIERAMPAESGGGHAA